MSISKKNEYGANLHNLWFYIAENIQKLIIFPQSCWPWRAQNNSGDFQHSSKSTKFPLETCLSFKK